MPDRADHLNTRDAFLREELTEFNCHFKHIEYGNVFVHVKWLSGIPCMCICKIPTSAVSLSVEILVIKSLLWSFRLKFFTEVQMSLSSQQTEKDRSQDYLRALSRHMLYDCP
jgi:hypothetical protein